MSLICPQCGFQPQDDDEGVMFCQRCGCKLTEQPFSEEVTEIQEEKEQECGDTKEHPGLLAKLKPWLIVAGIALFVVIVLINIRNTRALDETALSGLTTQTEDSDSTKHAVDLIRAKNYKEATIWLINKQDDKKYPDAKTLYNFACAMEEMDECNYVMAEFYTKDLPDDYKGSLQQEMDALKTFFKQTSPGKWFPPNEKGIRIRIGSIQMLGSKLMVKGEADVPDGSIISVSLSRPYITIGFDKVYLEAYGNVKMVNNVRAEYAKVIGGKFAVSFPIDNVSWWQRVKRKDNTWKSTEEVSNICRLLITFTPYLDSKSGQPSQTAPAFNAFGKDFEKLKNEPGAKSIREEIKATFGGELPDPTTPDGYFIQVVKHVMLPFDVDWEKDIPKEKPSAEATPPRISANDSTTSDEAASPREFEKLVVERGRPIIVGASVEDDKGKALSKFSSKFLGIWVSSEWYSMGQWEKEYFIKLHLNVFNQWTGGDDGMVIVYDSYLNTEVGSGNKFGVKVKK